MRKTYVLLVLAVCVAGCATTADNYGGGPEASQALAECRAASNSSPALVNAAANPFFAAAEQQQYVVDCMRARGFTLN